MKLVIGDAVLYHGDAMNILPLVQADLLCMDPPYKLTSGGGTPSEGKKMSGKFNLEKYNNNGNIVDCDIDWQDFMPLCYHSLRDNSHAYIMCNNRNVQDMLNSARWPAETDLNWKFIKQTFENSSSIKSFIKNVLSRNEGFKFHNLLIWEKDNATPNRWYMKNCEFTGFFYKGKAKYVNDCGAKQLLYVPQEPYGNHPTTKPVMLMKHYIEQSSAAGDTVLDPFMGSCSTGVAALKAGRKFIGIEKDKEYFDLSVARIKEYYSSSHQSGFI